MKGIAAILFLLGCTLFTIGDFMSKRGRRTYSRRRFKRRRMPVDFVELDLDDDGDERVDHD